MRCLAFFLDAALLLVGIISSPFRSPPTLSSPLLTFIVSSLTCLAAARDLVPGVGNSSRLVPLSDARPRLDRRFLDARPAPPDFMLPISLLISEAGNQVPNSNKLKYMSCRETELNELSTKFVPVVCRVAPCHFYRLSSKILAMQQTAARKNRRKGARAHQYRTSLRSPHELRPATRT